MRLYVATIIVLFGVLPAARSRCEPPASQTEEHDPGTRGFTEPIRISQVACMESGVVAELMVRPGEKVVAGQCLAALDRGVLLAQRASAEAQSQSTARYDSAQVRVELAKQRHGKLRTLIAEGHGSMSELDRAEADLRLAQIELIAAEEEQLLRKLELDRIDAEIARREVRSPLDGVVLEVHREAGEAVSAADPVVVTIAQLEKLRVKFYVPYAQAIALRQGLPVQVRLLGERKVVRAEIDFVAPVTEPDSRTIRVDAVIVNSDLGVRSGAPCVLQIDDAVLGGVARDAQSAIPNPR